MVVTTAFAAATRDGVHSPKLHRYTDLDLHHVQPTGVLGCVMELQAAGKVSYSAPAVWVERLSSTTRMWSNWFSIMFWRA
jgi:hypothetical protein